MDTLTLLNIALALVNLAVATFQGWREWRERHPPAWTIRPAHPLEAVLREIAQAIASTKH